MINGGQILAATKWSEPRAGETLYRVVLVRWPLKKEYSTHIQNQADEALFAGHYSKNILDAAEEFKTRTRAEVLEIDPEVR
jgi:hypothetical protein